MPATSPLASHMRSRRRGALRSAATKRRSSPPATATVTRRLPNSTQAWKRRGATTPRLVQLGQSEQPSPEPVNLTAAPEMTVTAKTTTPTAARVLKVSGGTVRRYHGTPGIVGAALSITANGTTAGTYISGTSPGTSQGTSQGLVVKRG